VVVVVVLARHLLPLRHIASGICFEYGFSKNQINYNLNL
jgi:hypothetical protein